MRWFNKTNWTRWFSLTLLLFGVISGIMGCGPSIEVDVSFREPQPQDFVRGWVRLQVNATPNSQVKEVLFAAQLADDDKSWKVLERKAEPPYVYDWDTTVEIDGEYKLEVEVLFKDGRVIKKQVLPVWVVNRIAQLSFKQCGKENLVARNTLNLSLEFKTQDSLIPQTPVELFVQGKVVQVIEKAPYNFKVDLSKFKHGTEVYLSAVATKGLYRGSSAVCSVFVDRKGPRISMLYPDKPGVVVPQKFNALLEVQEDFGVARVEIRLNGKVLSTLTKPPYQVPLDLSKQKHGEVLTLEAVGFDKAGNQTASPPKVTVIVDSKPPKVTVVRPKPKDGYMGKIQFTAEITDETGVGRVNFYLEDMQGKRLDNLLYTTGARNKSNTYETTVDAGISLYGSGERMLVVIAEDVNNNQTIQKVPFIIGCKSSDDCPAQEPPARCLEYRCIVPQPLGAVCDRPFSCEPPFVCFFGGTNFCSSEKLGVCRKPCDKGPCPAGFFCRDGGKQKDVCYPGDACSPFTLNCNGANQCVPWGVNSFVCMPTGTKKAGELCFPYSCSSSNGCQKTSACVPYQSGPNVGKGFCAKLCDQSFPTRDCQGNERCVSYPLRDGKKNSMGFCSTPSP